MVDLHIRTTHHPVRSFEGKAGHGWGKGPRIKVCDPMLGADFGEMAAPEPEGLRLAEMAYLSEGQIPEEVGHGAVL